MKINIIGDIAGRYDELMLLLAKMPEADLILSVGDMVDRGPKSKQVIQWFMKMQKAGKAEAIYGNHEDLMYHGVKNGNLDLWLYNGGAYTVKSYVPKNKVCYTVKELLEAMRVPASHIEWLEKRPMYFQTDDLFVSHAPVTSLKYVPSDPYGRDHHFIWNRYEPGKPLDKFVINGHNGRFREYKWGDGSVYGMCVDNSHAGVLTGIHWPTKEVFEQEFLPHDEPLLTPRELNEEEKKAEEEKKKQLELLLSCMI